MVPTTKRLLTSCELYQKIQVPVMTIFATRSARRPRPPGNVLVSARLRYRPPDPVGMGG